MQAVVDANRKFLDLSIKAPGATNDSLAWSLSSLAHWLEDGGIKTLTKDFALNLFNLPNGFFWLGIMRTPVQTPLSFLFKAMFQFLKTLIIITRVKFVLT
jgi:hypothetical protein